MEKANLVLEFLKIILSGHIVTGCVVLIFTFLFRKELAGLINRIASIEFPGGGKLSTSQSEKVSAELSSNKELPSVPTLPHSELPKNLSLTPDQAKAIEEVIQSNRAQAYLWEYRYLNYFLVFNTQRVLDWLASLNNRVNLSLYDTNWLPVIPSAQERQAILGALEQHHLILMKADLIEVTEKGREYIQWRGALKNAAT